jgi:hypothetical protein
MGLINPSSPAGPDVAISATTQLARVQELSRFVDKPKGAGIFPGKLYFHGGDSVPCF